MAFLLCQTEVSECLCGSLRSLYSSGVNLLKLAQRVSITMDHSQDVKIHFLDYWRIIRVRLGLVFLMFLLVLGTAAVVTYFMPREYRSFATIEVQPDMTSVRIFDNQAEAMNNSVYDLKFVPTQFQIITRKGVLYPVIDQLGLQKKWGTNGLTLPMEIAYNKLQRMLSLQEVRNTNLIQITVFSVDRAEAALLANTIAEVYMNQQFDVTLFDSTPVLGVSDAAIVTTLVDATLLVVHPGRFPRSTLLRVKKCAHRSQCKRFGYCFE